VLNAILKADRWNVIRGNFFGPFAETVFCILSTAPDLLGGGEAFRAFDSEEGNGNLPSTFSDHPSLNLWYKTER
jgi:hypothetical protein